MKIKQLFIAILAGAALLGASCTPGTLVPTLAEFNVEQSYIGFPASGGTVTTPVTATAAWSIDAAPLPSWLTVTPTGGNAGNTTLTFSTLANETGKELSKEVKIIVGDKTQTITVRQAAEAAGEVAVTPIKDVIAAGAGTFRIEGTVTSIASDSYGNFYVKDDTGEIYIYGAKNSSGQYPKDATGGWAKFAGGQQIEAGDKIVVEGPFTLYNNTPELVDVAIIKLTKSLIQVNPASVEVEAEAGTFELTVTAKVNGVTPVVESDWVRFADIAASGSDLVYTFVYDLNNSTASRQAEIVFKAPGELKSVTVTQKGGEPQGALSVAELVAQITSSDSKNPSNYKADFRDNEVVVSYVNGKNAFLEDKTGAILLYLADHGLNAGDKITGILSGSGYLYNGLPEITGIGDEYTAVAGGTIPETVVSVETLIDNYSSYLSRRVKLEGVTVTDGIAKDDRDGVISQFGNDINLRAQINGVTVETGATGDLIVFPTLFKETKQVGIWEDAAFTPGEVKEEPVTVASITKQIDPASSNNARSTFEANLTGAVVSYVNGNNAFIEDASGAILLYLKDHGLKAGDKISGKVSGEGYYYNGLPEIVSLGTAYTKAEGGTIPCTEMTIADLLKDYEANFSRRILLKDVTVTGEIKDGTRNGEVSQGDSKIAVYAQLKESGLVLEKDAKGSLICYPAIYKKGDDATYQVGFWDNADFTK